MMGGRVRYEVELTRQDDGYAYKVFRRDLVSGQRINLTGLAGMADDRAGALMEANEKCKEYHRNRVWRETTEVVELFEADIREAEELYFPTVS